jgi:hypothetical protein
MDGYLAKPIRAADLLGLIREAMKKTVAPYAPLGMQLGNGRTHRREDGAPTSSLAFLCRISYPLRCSSS